VFGICIHNSELIFQVEISPSDGNETQVAYEELSVLVTADTFEKVDAAVVLIELLITSVSVSFTELKITENYLFVCLLLSICILQLDCICVFSFNFCRRFGLILTIITFCVGKFSGWG